MTEKTPIILILYGITANSVGYSEVQYSKEFSEHRGCVTEDKQFFVWYELHLYFSNVHILKKYLLYMCCK